MLLQKAENVARKNNEEKRKQGGGRSASIIGACLPVLTVANNAICLPSDLKLVNSGLSIAQMKAIPWYIDSCSSLTLGHDARDFEDLDYSS